MQVNKDLIRLVVENPDLPVVAMVNGEVTEGEGAYWMASFSAASIEKVGLIDEHWYDDVDSFKEVYYDKYSTELCEKFDYDPRCCMASIVRGEHTEEQFAANCLAEEKLEAYLSEKANEYMRKCIVVYVDAPDMTDWREA